MEALLTGQQIADIAGWTWAASIDGEIGTVCYRNQEECVNTAVGWELNSFIRFCNALTDEEIAVIAAQTALMKINRSKRG